jgi:hypothetical protein
MLHNKANSSSWAHFGHDSHTNQKEKIFLTLQIPLGSGRRWHILHWVQVPSELLRSSLDGSTIQSYPESTSLGISAGWSWFVGMYIAPTSNILSSWDWLSSHFGDSQGPPTAEWGLKESTSFPSDKISWNRTRSPGGWKQCQSTTATIRHEPTMFSLRLRRSQFHKFAGFRNVLVWWFFSPEK